MDSRTIYLAGEASFQVYKKKKKPFIVKTSGVDVQALGTVFTVKSYAGEDYTTTTLEEGSVKVSLKNGMTQSYVLKPSEQLVYSHRDHSVQRNRVDLSLSRRLSDFRGCSFLATRFDAGKEIRSYVPIQCNPLRERFVSCEVCPG